MNITRTLVVFLSALLLVAALALPVFADGTTKEVCTTKYGGATECHTETVTEDVTHSTETVETKDAGIGDINLYALAGIASSMGLGLYILAKVTRGVYVLD